MKKIKYIVGFMSIAVLFEISGCKSDDSGRLTEEQIQLAQLAKQWKPTNEQFVTLDNEDVSSSFKNFILTFDKNKNFSTENGNDPVWPQSGTFEFEMKNGSPNFNRVIRSDGVVIDIVELSDNSLRMEFFYKSASGGRVNGVSGAFSFALSPQ